MKRPMSASRRQLLKSLAGASAVAPWVGLSGARAPAGGRATLDRGHAEPGGAKNNSGGVLDVALFLDAEDIFSPPEVGNDDAIKQLANILTEEHLRANFLFIGDKAALLKERGREDVIASLEPHVVGLHTRSERHPVGPEYVAGKSWDDAVAESLRHEREGAEIIQQVFGRPCAALSPHYSWPHNQRVAALLGLPYVYTYSAAPPLYNLSWYAGALGLPFLAPTLNNQPFRGYFGGFDGAYPKDSAFEDRLRQLGQHVDVCLTNGQPFLTLFLYHPLRLHSVQFPGEYWSANGVNLPKEHWGKYGRPALYTSEEVRISLTNFRRLARWLRQDPRLNIMALPDVVRKYGQQPKSITREELSVAAQEIVASEEILIHPRFSPAEITVGFAHAIVFHADNRRPSSEVPRDDVLGPTRSPIWVPELQGCSYSSLVAFARQLLDHTKSSGQLPATIGGSLERVGVNHLYRAFAETYLAISANSQLSEIKFHRRAPWPTIAPAIGMQYLQYLDGPTVTPDIDINTLYRDGKLQTWTLKPAMPPSVSG